MLLDVIPYHAKNVAQGIGYTLLLTHFHQFIVKSFEVVKFADGFNVFFIVFDSLIVLLTLGTNAGQKVLQL